LTAPVGSGGRGEIWKGWDQRDRRQVAVKLLSPALVDDDVAKRMFRSEAHNGASVHHPHIVETLDFLSGSGADGGNEPEAIVQGFIEGKSLAAHLEGGATMEAPRILRILAAVARGLRAVHTADLVHRDVSPQNILLEKDDFPVLIDFGISSPIGSPSLNAQGAIPGNPDYLAPELSLGRPVTPSADLYSLGTVLFRAITGATPFRAASPELTATAHVLSPSPELPKDLPADLRIFFRQLTAKDPERRPTNALAVANLFDSWAQALAPAHTGNHAA
jgi:serine/threonine-protein kinase